MRGALFLLPLLLVGCAPLWPGGSYVEAVSEKDAAVLSPAIVDYLSAALPPGASISVAPSSAKDDPIAARLAIDLEHAGLNETGSGQMVTYVAEPLGEGLLLRIMIDDREGASQYFLRKGEALAPAGPLTVAQP